MDRAERRRNAMLLPTFGNGRLPRKQCAEILKADCIWRYGKQRQPNADRRNSRLPTQKRNCSPSTQRHTTTPCHRPPPGGDNATYFLMNRLTLRRR
jgi:hypothetical protein